MEQLDKDILTVQNGLKAAADAISSIAKAPAIVPEMVDRSISGNKINGGKITNFSSNGIVDTSTVQNVRITDEGITVPSITTPEINSAVTVNGELTVQGTITASKLHVDEISSDVRNERTSPLEFKGPSLAGKGLIWTGKNHTRQFTFQENEDRLFSSENVDLLTGKQYMVDNNPVLSLDTIGPTVHTSSLRRVGTLENLQTTGHLNVDNFIFWDSDSMRLGIGTESPNGMVSVKNLEHEFVIDYTEDLQYKIGTWTSTGLKIVTDDVERITVNGVGQITLHDRVNINGRLGIGVNNFNDVDISTAGPVKFQNKKFEVSNRFPTSGSYNQGDIVWNDTPAPTAYVGWVCTRTGAPGDWKPFGAIAE